MAYTLFYKKGACNLAIHTLLYELGAEFDLESYYAEDGKSKNPELLAVNPRGKVPVLVDHMRDFVMYEGAAILTYLCDTHASSLLPTEGKARAMALQWLMFANSSLHSAYSKIFSLGGKYGELGLSDEVKDVLRKAAGGEVQSLWDQIEAHLVASNSDYMCGNAPTVGDLLLANIANWNAVIPVAIKLGNATQKMLKRASTLPSFVKALEAEGVKYKAV